MYKSASMKKAEKHGHKVEWFTPHWASWKAKCSARLSKEKARFLTCTRCLRVAGGDWGRKCQGANATNKSKLRAHWQDTSPQNRKLLLRIWGLTKEQVNARLGLGKRGLSLALRNHKRKKLVFDGIERQPGPSSGCTNPDRTYTSLWTINCGGAKGAWQVVNHELSNGPPLMLLQETALSEHEARSYGAAAFKQGYHAYFSGCERTSRREHGGAMILAKTSLKSASAWAFKDRGGAAQAVWLNGVLVISVYLAPVPESWKVVDEVAALVFSLSPEQSWLLGGDFNCLPSENPFSNTLSGLGGQLFQPNCPTRWNSDRCIDYYFTNMQLVPARTLEKKVADHKIVASAWQHVMPQVADYVVRTPPVLPQLQDVSPEAWTQAINAAWAKRRSDLSLDGEVDQVWDTLNSAFFDTLREAYEACSGCMPPCFEGRKGRGGKLTRVVVVKRDRMKSQPAGNFASFKQRALRNLLGRMLEFRQRRNSADISDTSLRQQRQLQGKIERSQFYDGSVSLSHNIFKLERELEQCLKQENKSRLQRWRTRMQKDKHAFRWLRRQTTEVTHVLKCSKNDSPSTSVQEGIEKLRSFWTQVWDRRKLERDQVWPVLANCLPPEVRSDRWVPLEGRDLKKAAQSCKGSAAGLDCWTAEELCLFSAAMWQILAEFYMTCEEQGMHSVYLERS